MGEQWKVKDADSEEEGTSHVVILASQEALSSAGITTPSAGWKHPYVRLASDTSVVGGIVHAVRPGLRVVELDPLLRRELQVPDGGTVEVQSLEPVAADEVEVAFPKSDLSETELSNLCRTYLAMQPLSKNSSKPLFLYSGERLDVDIVKVTPSDLCVMTRETRIVASQRKSSIGRIRFCDIGGLAREIQMLQERIIQPLRHRDFFASMGIRVPRGILLAGPPGCGKTLLARALSSELGITCLEVRGPEVFAGVYGESEKRIQELFSEARQKAPSLILIDEIDAIAPSRQSTRGELERRIVTMLLAEMDGLQDGGDAIVVGTTNEIDAIDAALRRPGRFDFELSIGAPDAAGRLEILKIHSRHMPLEDVPLEDIAKRTHGYSGADLMNLCRESAFNAVKRFLEGEESPEAELQVRNAAKVLSNDFEEAIRTLRPSALREFAVELPSNLSWDDVGGLDNIKQTLVEEVVHAIDDPETYSRMGIRPVRGVLLYGPPGTGKTLLARVIANRAGANFISVRGPEVLSKWVGESEQRIRHLFERARQVSPCVIFFDEIDALTAARGGGTNEVGDRVVNQLLTEMDGFQVSKQVCVIAATNRKDIIDPALLRPGRFDYMLEVPLPGPEERRRILEIHLKDKPVSDDIDLPNLASDASTKGLSGAHIAEICRRAAMEALRERSFNFEGTVITQQHLLRAVGAIREHFENLEQKIRKIGFREAAD